MEPVSAVGGQAWAELNGALGDVGIQLTPVTALCGRGLPRSLGNATEMEQAGAEPGPTTGVIGVK